MTEHIDYLVQAGVNPAISAAADRFFMQDLARSCEGSALLRVYTYPGDVLLLGRYHLAPSRTDGKVAVWRRFSGGRVLPFGDGFLGLSLILPHRSALVADEPLALAAHQVPNRYVRGIMEMLRLLGLDPFYPGRDLVMVKGRCLAAVSFETDDQDVLIFEAVIAYERDFSLLMAFLERTDPDGLVKAAPVPGEVTTSIVRECSVNISCEEAAKLLCDAFARQFGKEIRERKLGPSERQAIEDLAVREYASDRWVRERLRRPELDRHACTPIQLGFFDVYLALQENRITIAQFAGDFIANSPAIAALEKRLRGCVLERRALSVVSNQLFSDPRNYMLGIGKLDSLEDTILRAAGMAG